MKDLTKILTIEEILSEEKRSTVLKNIAESTILSDAKYANIGLTLIHQLINSIQQLPDSSNTYFSQLGGCLDRSLQRTEAALELFKQFLIPAEDGKFSEQQQLWQYALFTASILQGSGKLYIDYEVELYDNNGHFIKDWNPLLGNLVSEASYYCHNLLAEQKEEFRKRLNLLVAQLLMPLEGYKWLVENKEVLEIWLALLNEDYDSAGVFGAILQRADAIAIQNYFLQQASGLQSSKGSALSRISTFAGGGEGHDREALGLEFLQWLNKMLENGKISINKAPLFHVPGGLLMCPEIFQLFTRDHPGMSTSWKTVEKSFKSLGLNQMSQEVFRHEHNSTLYSGSVMRHYGVALPKEVQLHNPHTGKNTPISALELIYQSQHNQLSSAKTKAESLPLLNANGQWVKPQAQSPDNSIAPSSF